MVEMGMVDIDTDMVDMDMDMMDTHPSQQFHKFGTFTVNLPEKRNTYVGKISISL